MHTLRRVAALAAGCGLLLAVAAGCGGGGGGGLIDLTGSGTLDSGDSVFTNGTYFDSVNVRATRDGLIRATMDRAGSNPVADPFLAAFRADETASFVVNDDGGSGLNATLQFTATAGALYRIAFSTFRAGDSGSYSYTIREVDASSRAVADDDPAKPGAAPTARVAP
ncbi:MAG: hypothetical protein IT204_05260 [Fimbriimonadaceae bacterium]|nr:hypothetical protein [Fimbriimonadaceae bacterium]